MHKERVFTLHKTKIQPGMGLFSAGTFLCFTMTCSILGHLLLALVNPESPQHSAGAAQHVLFSQP